MILKADAIAKLLRDGQRSEIKDPLVVTPGPVLTEIEDSGSASLDLRLGTWFVSLRQARMTHLSIGKEERIRQLTKTHYVPFGQEYILHPRSFVLGTTLEWIRLPTNVAGYLMGKSSWGRRGLIIATAAAVHPGFKGCLALELTNVGEIPIAISPGMTICQLCLHDSGATTEKVDRSRFIGQRKPVLGKIVFDDIAEKIAQAYRNTQS